MPATAAHPIGANTDPRPHALVLLGAALTGTGAKGNMVPGVPLSKPADAEIADLPCSSLDGSPAEQTDGVKPVNISPELPQGMGLRLPCR